MCVLIFLMACKNNTSKKQTRLDYFITRHVDNYVSCPHYVVTIHMFFGNMGYMAIKQSDKCNEITKQSNITEL